MMHATIQVHRSGRKKHRNVGRYPCGKSRGEPEHAVKAVAWAYRTRMVGEAHKDDPMAGFTLGLLRLRGPQDPGGISPAQYDAGWQYAGIVRRHASVMGYSIGSPKSPGFELVSRETGDGEPPNPELIKRVREQFKECYKALVAAGVEIGAGTRVATVTYDACLDLIAFTELQADDVARGNLKVGLNALVRVLR